MKCFFKTILTSIFICTAIFCFSQTEKFQFTKIGVEDGLAHSHVFSITQDSEGFIWLGTMHGLSKYNGQEIINYRFSSADSTSISGNWVYSFFEDSSGEYYVATSNGFNKFNKEFGTFERFYHVEGDLESLSSNTVRDIVELDNGNLALATGAGVDYFNPQTKKFQNFTHPKFGYERHSPRIYKDNNSTIWVAGINGIYKVNEKEKKLDYFPLISSEGNPILVRRILQDEDENYWLATDKGLYIFHKDAAKFEHIPISNEIVETGIKALIHGENNTFYIGSMHGLIHWDIKLRKPITIHSYSSNNPGGITVNNIYSLMKDRHNNIWIGMFRNADVLSKSSEKFKVFYNEYGINNLSNTMLEIFVDSKDRVWVSTITGMFLKEDINSKSKLITGVNTPYEDLTSIRDFEEDSNGDIWFTIRRNGLYKVLSKTQEIIEVEKSQFFKGHYLEEFLFDNQNSDIIWMATLGGICKYNISTRDTSWVYPSVLDTTLKSNKLATIEQQPNGVIWFVNSRRLCSYNPETNKIKVYKTDKNDSTAWYSGYAFNLEVDSSRVYLSGGSFSYLDIEKGTFVNFNGEHEEAVGSSTAVLIADDGNVWMAGGPNVRAYNPTDNSFKFYNLNKETRGFITGARNKGKNGKLYFGGSDGLLEINPNVSEIEPIKDPIVLSKFSISYEEKKFDKAIEFVRSVELKSNENIFEIEYTALNYTNQDNLNYRYKLKGFEDEWIDVGDRRSVTFTNLFPGKYTFLAEATNENGLKVTDTLVLEIVIVPPFYKTNWFYAFLILVGLILFCLIYRNRKQKQKLRQAKILADQKALYKSKFLTNMSHELRTPMNAIMGLNNLMLSTPLNQKQKKYTEAIHLSCENLLWIINDILDQAKIESGKLKIKSEPFNLRAVIDQVKLLLINKIEEKGLQFSLNIDDKIPDNLIGDPVRIFQILTNLIGNAIKFSEKGVITLNISKQKNETDKVNILFEVIDTGIGIRKEKLEAIFKSFEQAEDTERTKNYGSQGTGLGLSIAKELTELMNGNLRVESKLHEGSRFYFTLPFQIAEQLSEDQNLTAQSIPKELKILLVEDTPMNQFVAIELLNKHLENPIIEQAKNGEEAVEKIKSANFDLVLMDIKMPVMDGLEATKLIRKMDKPYFKSVPIIGLTANAIQQQIDACFEAGMNECITKPIIVNELLTKIRTELNKQVK